ncbi:MAG: hypothetical protein ACREM9_08865 [Gemmatimonadales bacterium]
MRPWDEPSGARRPSNVCLSDYAFHEHRLPLTLRRSGGARVRVVGMRASAAASVLDSVETGVTVRPEIMLEDREGNLIRQPDRMGQPVR